MAERPNLYSRKEPGATRKNPVSVAELRLNIGEVLRHAHYNNEVVYISQWGKPHAAVVSHADGRVLEFLRKQLGEEAFTKLRQKANEPKPQVREPKDTPVFIPEPPVK